MSENHCENCKLRLKHDQKPKSFIGRFWRWHINWCPGWKAYMSGLDNEQREQIARQYQLKKHLTV
jgi:hypothetical protein